MQFDQNTLAHRKAFECDWISNISLCLLSHQQTETFFTPAMGNKTLFCQISITTAIGPHKTRIILPLRTHKGRKKQPPPQTTPDRYLLKVSWKMIYCLAHTVHYTVCIKQPAYGVSAQLLLWGIFSWRINLPLWFNSLWQAWKLALYLSVKDSKWQHGCNVLLQIDHIWDVMRSLFRANQLEAACSVCSSVSLSPSTSFCFHP